MYHLIAYDSEQSFSSIEKNNKYVFSAVPGVSLCLEDNKSAYNRTKKKNLIVDYKVQAGDSQPVRLLNSSVQTLFNNIYEMTVDGVKLNNPVSSYTFNEVGIHTVTFDLYDEMTQIPSGLLKGVPATRVVVPNGIESIEWSAIAGCQFLTEIELPKTLKTLGPGAFSGNTALENIVFPNSVTRAQHRGLYGCTSLTGVTLSKNMTLIDQAFFGGCSSLQDLTLHEGIVAFEGHGTFTGCTSLTGLTIPESVIYMGDDTLEGSAWFENGSCPIINNMYYPTSKIAYKCIAPTGTTTSWTFEEGTTSVSPRCFNVNHTRIRTLTFPSSTKNIGLDEWFGTGNDGTVIQSTSMNTIYCYAQEPPVQKLGRIANTGTVYHPAGTDYSSWLPNWTKIEM